ncbi:hypothetical protein Pan153_01280 [Gimesia panareensis]|uniref:Uncharacterized protein n=1 Tax=Gimesia panareensis TaxID=2527978 RepID=A0A518FGP9_9PLAN|nr:hypothetical protein Pan153_01280 [Gimesia panareensis]
MSPRPERTTESLRSLVDALCGVPEIQRISPGTNAFFDFPSQNGLRGTIFDILNSQTAINSQQPLVGSVMGRLITGPFRLLVLSRFEVVIQTRTQ